MRSCAVGRGSRIPSPLAPSRGAGLDDRLSPYKRARKVLVKAGFS